MIDDIRPNVRPGKLRFTDEFRLSVRRRGLSYSTEKTYLHWVLRFIRFHSLRHPSELNATDVEAFLDDLSQTRRCAVSTQRTALNALVFLFEKHFESELGALNYRPAKRVRRAPTVFTHAEAQAIIAKLSGIYTLVAGLLYGSGLRLNEALRLRVKDIDFGAQQITVRDGKGANERFTLLPNSLAERLQQQIIVVEKLHAYDTAQGYGEVFMPDALERKYPSASRSIEWQFLIPASRVGVDPVTGMMRRHHLHDSAVQREVRGAIRKAKIRRRASCHTFRHSFATRLIETGYDIKLVQSLLGHRDIRTTEIYLHVVRNRAGAIVSPMDSV